MNRSSTSYDKKISTLGRLKEKANWLKLKGKQKVNQVIDKKIKKIEPSERYTANSVRYKTLVTTVNQLHGEAKRYTDAAAAQIESSFRFQQLLLEFAMNCKAGNACIEEFEAFQGIRSRLIHIQKELLEKGLVPFTKSFAGFKEQMVDVKENKNEAKAAMLWHNNMRGKLVSNSHVGDGSVQDEKFQSDWAAAQARYGRAERNFESCMDDFETDMVNQLLSDVASFVSTQRAEFAAGVALLEPISDWITHDLPSTVARLLQQRKVEKEQQVAAAQNAERVSELFQKQQQRSNLMIRVQGFLSSSSFEADFAAPTLLEGEDVLLEARRVVLVSHGNTLTVGVLLLTPFRLIFRPYLLQDASPESPRTRSAMAAAQSAMAVHLMAVERADCLVPEKALLTVWSKDKLTFLFDFTHSPNSHAHKFQESLTHFAFSCKPFAFYHASSSPASSVASPRKDAGWEFHSLAQDYNRLGLADSPWWRVSNVNANYSISKTYPSLLVVPRAISDEDCKNASVFRKKKRFPVLVWLMPSSTTGAKYPQAGIFRCSQPKLGITKKRSQHDEHLLRAIGCLTCQLHGGETSKLATRKQSERSAEVEKPCIELSIMDMRPQKNAVANLAKGGGWELEENYPGCTISFLNIENIHYVRAAFSALRQEFLVLPSSDLSVEGLKGPELPASLPNPAAGPEQTKQASSLVQQHLSYLSQLMDTRRYSDILATLRSGSRLKWFKSISSILNAAAKAALLVSDDKRSVLVHCSDGWDRTPQVTALCQLLLDPYYRTLEGFATLVSKEWLAFGHKFEQRTGQQDGEAERANHSDSQRSPIFLQWIECIYQCLCQHPTAFGFNVFFLADLSDHVMSGRFGDFLKNTEQARNATVAGRCNSLWGFVLHKSVKPYYANPAYAGAPLQGSEHLVQPLRVDCSMDSMRLFLPYVLRWDSCASPTLSLANVCISSMKASGASLALAPAAAHPTTAPPRSKSSPSSSKRSKPPPPAMPKRRPPPPAPAAH